MSLRAPVDGSRRTLLRGAIVAAFVGTWGREVPAEDAPAGQSTKRDSETVAEERTGKELAEYRGGALRYEIATDGVPTTRLVLREEPALHWTNPQRGTVGGVVWLWLAEGRPLAIASFFRYTDAGRTVEDHEFQSLSPTPLTARRTGQPVWVPRSAGVTFQPIPGAPAPAATKGARLRQMRALAREFRAYFDGRQDRSELRLLTQPLYRFETKDEPGASDGALFAFVQSTDPEALLLIETLPVAGTPVWHYAFARMSMVNLLARHKERVVWTVPWAYDFSDPTSPYVTLRAPSLSR